MSGSVCETIHIYVLSAYRESPDRFPNTFGRSNHCVGDGRLFVPSLEKDRVAFHLNRLRTGIINLF